jgi:hypothetical protein
MSLYSVFYTFGFSLYASRNEEIPAAERDCVYI